MLTERAFWAESQDQESGGQIGPAFTQGGDDEDETPAQSPSAPVSPRSGDIAEKPGGAGKVAGFLIPAAVITAVVYFMQT